jgi:hypothetical protein
MVSSLHKPDQYTIINAFFKQKQGNLMVLPKPPSQLAQEQGKTGPA